LIRLPVTKTSSIVSCAIAPIAGPNVPRIPETQMAKGLVLICLS
jgi:hypothetical protein